MRACVGHDVSACWSVGVSEKLGGVCLNVICDYARARVEGTFEVDY